MIAILIKYSLLNYNFLSCVLLGNILLPPLNTLPCTYWELCALMKDIGMEYQITDAFPTECIIILGRAWNKDGIP